MQKKAVIWNNGKNISWCNYMQIFTLVALILVILSIKSPAQNNNYIHSNASLAEKIYLQLDGKVYTTGNIVWFKSIVTNAYTHIPSSMSRVLYVELIAPDERILEKKLIKLKNGIGEGFFYLDNNLEKGQYLIRAYTEWDKNFGLDFFFEEYIHVFKPKLEGESAVINVTLNKEKGNEGRIQACFDPFVIDSLHKNDLTVILAFDDKKDTLSVKRGKDKLYRIDYEIVSKSQFATLQLKTLNHQSYSKTIVLNREFLDLQFFPESGELVHGLTSKVGFKATGANGQGKMVQGEIIDDRDSIVALFESNSLGMGSFVLSSADTSKVYFARLTSLLNNNQVLLYPLPAVAAMGNVLAITNKEQDVQLAIRSNYLNNDSIWLRFSQRGISFYEKKYGLSNGELNLILSGQQLPEGIIAFTLLDKNKQIVAERLYFNEKPESRINIELSTNKTVYTKRELTELSIKTSNANDSLVKTNLSLLVINKNQLGQIQKMRQNILSWFLLDSELRGEIENPGIYFNSDSCMHEDLDALMLTQGWRKYHYAKPFDDLAFKPEKSLKVGGHISGLLSAKKRKEASLVMFTYGTSKNAYSLETDSLGNFEFILDDEYGQKMNVLIHSTDVKGNSRNFTVSLDNHVSPPVNYNRVKAFEEADSFIYEYLVQNEERQKVDEAFPLDSGNILIEEVEVKAYRLTPARKLVMKRYGDPDVIIDGKDILEKEQKWSYGLYSVLLFNFPGQIRIYNDILGGMYAHVIGSSFTLVIVDGIPAKLHDYMSLPYIPPSEVSSFEIIRCASDFEGLFFEVFGRVNRYPFPCGSIIAIYTKAGKGILGSTKPKGFVKSTVPVFSAPREFYAPKYDNLSNDDWKRPDLRALIEWKPLLKTDSLGIATTSFYNTDIGGEVMVVVEAITDKGEIGYKEIAYKVEGEGREDGRPKSEDGRPKFGD